MLILHCNGHFIRMAGISLLALIMWLPATVNGQGKSTVALPRLSRSLVIENFDRPRVAEGRNCNTLSGPLPAAVKLESPAGIAVANCLSRGTRGDRQLRMVFDFGKAAGGPTTRVAVAFTRLRPGDGRGKSGAASRKAIDIHDLFGNAALPRTTVERVDLRVRCIAARDLQLRLELSDEGKRRRFCRRRMTPHRWHELKLRVPDDFARGAEQFDWSAVRCLKLIVVRVPIGSPAANPRRGAVLVDDVRLITSISSTENQR